MSFILDALKKSENERQRQIGPSLADVQMSRQKNDKPWWAVAVAGLLVVNLGVLIVVLTRSSGNDRVASSTVAAPEPDAHTAPASPVATAPARNVSSEASQAGQFVAAVSPAVHSLADEAGAIDGGVAPDAGIADAAVVPDGPPIVQPIDSPTVSAAPVFESRAAPRREERAEVLPTYSDIVAGGTSLPELHLDIHVHSGAAAERFVFVNMRKYIEGQSLSEGPSIERITTDGVVLNQRGLRFLLPRQ